MAVEIKYIKHIAFTEAELAGLNPNLFKGEVACVVNDTDGKVESFKIGPGLYNDLDPIVDIYPYTNIVTNQIGDILNGSDQSGRKLTDIIRDMISPYISPTVSGVQNKAEGSYKSSALIEIGSTINSVVDVIFTVNNQTNIAITDPMEVLAPDFTVNNPYPNAVISLTPLTPLIPAEPTIYSIQVRVQDTEGNFSSYSATTISFEPRIYWGASTEEDIVLIPPATEISIGSIGLLGGGNILSKNFKRTFEITVGHFAYVLIPSMLSPVNISWTEVTDVNSPAGIGMVDLGEIKINNGVGSYLYTKWRSPFSNINGVKLKAS